VLPQELQNLENQPDERLPRGYSVMDRDSRNAAIAAAWIMLLFGIGAFWLPSVMLALAVFRPFLPAFLAFSSCWRFSRCSGCDPQPAQEPGQIRESHMRILITGARAWSAASSSPGWPRTAHCAAQGHRARPARHRAAAGASQDGVSVTLHTGDLAEAGAAERLVASRPDVIFHLAGIVSGEAEANFDLATASTSTVLAPCSMPSGWPALHRAFVFTSSIAVFRRTFPGCHTR